MYIDREERPSVISLTTLVVALVLHLAFFGVMWALGELDFTAHETVISIDLTVVPFENLDGDDNEPPPEAKPEPVREPEPKEKPAPRPEKKEEPPPEREEPKPKLEDVVVPEPVKTNVVKATEKKPTEKPKESREDKIRRMLAQAKDVKTPPPAPPRTNGRTGPKTLSDEEVARRMKAGYRAGRVESLAANDNQLCLSLIKQAFYEEWTDRPPWKASLRDTILAVDLAENGTILGYRIVQSSTDRRADDSVLRAAAAVRRINGITHAFWVNNKRVDVRFHVTPN